MNNQKLSGPWDKEIKDLETFFETTMIPTHPVKLNNWTTITNPSKFILAHLYTVNHNNGEKIFLPYLERLQTLKKVLQYCNCEAPVIQLIPTEQCLTCKKPVKPKRIKS